MPPPIVLDWTAPANADLPPQAPSYFRPETYSLSPFANVKDDTEFTGFSQQRQHSSTYDFTAKASYILQPGQYLDFYNVIRSLLHNGRRWFLCELPSEEGYRVYLVRMSTPHTATPLGGGGWRVNIEYEVRHEYIPGGAFGGLVLGLGWRDSVFLSTGTAEVANTGTDAGSYDRVVFFSIIDYAGGDVVWSYDWQPVMGNTMPSIFLGSGDVFNSGEGIVFFDEEEGAVQISNPNNIGRFEISATVGGVPTNAIELVISLSEGFYFGLAWGPV